jgi:hypothetical protein
VALAIREGGGMTNAMRTRALIGALLSEGARLRRRSRPHVAVMIVAATPAGATFAFSFGGRA